jgi:hypothetical protein
MSIVDDLVANLVAQNTVRLNGTLSIRLLSGGVSVQGTIASTLHDQKRNKDILNINVPVDAQVKIADVVIPVPNIP